jgi:predicted dehydrogenase
MGQVAWLHASWTEWKNLFSFEVFARSGKIQVDGLGGSYGVERLTLFRMLPEMGPPETTGWEYPGEDLSWQDEFAAFVDATRGKATANATLEDAAAALHIVQAAYGRRTA